MIMNSVGHSSSVQYFFRNRLLIPLSTDGPLRSTSTTSAKVLNAMALNNCYLNPYWQISEEICGKIKKS